MQMKKLLNQLLKWNVEYGGASDYHDELGHLLPPVFLTKWPLWSEKPIVFSTDHMVMEQIATMCQRMMIRGTPVPVNDCNILYPNSVSEEQKQQLIKKVIGEIPESRHWIRMPNYEGEKFSKQEVLAWCQLYDIQDLWILVKDELKEDIPDEELFENFKLMVAEMIYQIAMMPEESQPEKRASLMANPFDLMKVERTQKWEEKMGYYLKDEQLEDWFDSFIKPLDQLDNSAHDIYGKGYSQMTLPELLQTDLEKAVLPEAKVPFKTVWKEEEVEKGIWNGLLDYDAERDFYVIKFVIHPDAERSDWQPYLN